MAKRDGLRTWRVGAGKQPSSSELSFSTRLPQTASPSLASFPASSPFSSLPRVPPMDRKRSHPDGGYDQGDRKRRASPPVDGGSRAVSSKARARAQVLMPGDEEDGEMDSLSLKVEVRTQSLLSCIARRRLLGRRLRGQEGLLGQED